MNFQVEDGVSRCTSPFARLHFTWHSLLLFLPDRQDVAKVVGKDIQANKDSAERVPNRGTVNSKTNDRAQAIHFFPPPATAAPQPSLLVKVNDNSKSKRASKWTCRPFINEYWYECDTTVASHTNQSSHHRRRVTLRKHKIMPDIRTHTKKICHEYDDRLYAQTQTR